MRDVAFICFWHNMCPFFDVHVVLGDKNRMKHSSSLFDISRQLSARNKNQCNYSGQSQKVQTA